jgi:SpoIIAA-like
VIEILSGFPANVAACKASGRVSMSDYDDVLIPAVERALNASSKIRCYYELGPGFEGFDPGAVWEDARMGVEHFMRWERVAVVTDVEWIRHAAQAFRFLMPAQVHVYSLDEAPEARQWISEP